MNHEDIIYGIVYIPPIRPRYTHEDSYLEIQQQPENVCSNTKYVVLCGDFNSISSNLEDIVQADAYLNEFYGNFELRNESFTIFERNNIAINRENADRTVNSYGYKMIDFCKNNDIFILNGRIGPPGNTSKFTCKDSSTIDYVRMTPNCFDTVHSLFIDGFNCLYSISHCPVSLYLNI